MEKFVLKVVLLSPEPRAFSPSQNSPRKGWARRHLQLLCYLDNQLVNSLGLSPAESGLWYWEGEKCPESVSRLYLYSLTVICYYF